MNSDGTGASSGNLSLFSLGASISLTCFIHKKSVKITKHHCLPQLCGKMLGLISIAKAQVHLDCVISHPKVVALALLSWLPIAWVMHKIGNNLKTYFCSISPLTID